MIGLISGRNVLKCTKEHSTMWSYNQYQQTTIITDPKDPKKIPLSDLTPAIIFPFYLASRFPTFSTLTVPLPKYCSAHQVWFRDLRREQRTEPYKFYKGWLYAFSLQKSIIVLQSSMVMVVFVFILLSISKVEYTTYTPHNLFHMHLHWISVCIR